MSRAELVEAAARIIAEALGDDFDQAFASKTEWIAERGMRGGRMRDINEPFRSDYLEAALEVVALVLEEAAKVALNPPPSELKPGALDTPCSFQRKVITTAIRALGDKP